MVSIIYFMQAKLQHSIAASRVISRTVRIKGIHVALILKPWYHKGYIWGLNIPGNTLFSASGKDRPRTCILMRNKKPSLLPGYTCRDLVAVLIQYNKDGAEQRLAVCLAYLPYDSKDPSPSMELEELVRYCEN